MKNFLMILMIVASSFIPFVAFAQANFVRDLFVGISGSDVFDLQKILNSDSETQIAESFALSYTCSLIRFFPFFDLLFK